MANQEIYLQLKKNQSTSKVEFRCLPQQGLDDNRPVSGDQILKMKYPLGTVFVTDFVHDMGTGNLRCGNLKVVHSTAEIESGDRAPQDVVERFLNFHKTLSGTNETQAVKNTASSKENETTLQKLRRLYPNPTLKDPRFNINQEVWEQLLTNIDGCENSLLTGPTGTGKTELVLKLGEVLGLPVRVFNMGTIFDPNEQLLGTLRMRDGQVYFDYADLPLAIQQPGIVLFDEISRAGTEVLNVLLPLLDNRRELSIPQAGRGEDRTIKAHEDCFFIGTANIGARYVGTHVLDPALTSRFSFIEISHLGVNEEASVLASAHKITASNAKTIAMVANRIRESYKNNGISTEISCRDTLKIAKKVEQGYDLDTAMSQIIIPQYEMEERLAVKSILTMR